MRAFAAIMPPENIRDSYSRLCRKMRGNGEISLVRSDKMHITLAFFDDLKREDVNKVKSAIESLTLNTFEIRFTGIGRFMRRGITSVIYSETKSDNLSSFTDAFRKNLRKLEVPYENKPFKPHLTLARVREIKKPDDFERMFTYLTHNFPDTAFNVSEIILFSSDLITYKEIFRVNFIPSPS